MPRATPPAMQPTTVAPNCAAKLAARHAFTPSRPASPAVRAGSISAAYRAAVPLDQTETPDRARPGEGLGAEGGTRTHTSVTSLRPERSASTYSATSARSAQVYTRCTVGLDRYAGTFDIACRNSRFVSVFPIVSIIRSTASVVPTDAMMRRNMTACRMTSTLPMHSKL